MGLKDYKILLDFPADKPALGFDDAAQALKEIIEGSRPQFAVGVFGSWGSGKTTLMRAIERRLDPAKSIAVQFSAWRYEREPHLIVPLLDTVREALAQWAEQNAGLKDKALETASTVGKAMYSLLTGLSFKFGLPGAVELSFKANEALERGEQFGEEEKQAKVSRSFYHATFRALHEAFKGFLGDGTGRRIVVFVDDLDRCLPQGALEVLETMKLFFDLEGFVFVVGLDQAVVERIIDIKYRKEAAGGGVVEEEGYEIRGADYIKKIFQLPYAVAPVAVTQLDEFLDAVYEEAQLPPDQETELRNEVAPHLRYLVTESGVNPREIKRYVNAYTLVIKIKPHLNKNVVLALRTIAFRRDWLLVQKAMLSYREIFTDAVSRQLNGNEDTALADLDPQLAGIPESFMTYVSQGNPAQALLTTPNLDEYIYSGEAATSSRGTQFIDSIRDVAQLTTMLEKGKAGDKELHDYFGKAESALGILRDVTRGKLERPIQRWKNHLSLATTPMADAQKSEWFKDEEQMRRGILNQLMELYQAGSQTPTSA
jgi:energy-coupling factor transporter ATP-binding protein EcfA2